MSVSYLHSAVSGAERRSETACSSTTPQFLGAVNRKEKGRRRNPGLPFFFSFALKSWIKKNRGLRKLSCHISYLTVFTDKKKNPRSPEWFSGLQQKKTKKQQQTNNEIPGNPNYIHKSKTQILRCWMSATQQTVNGGSVLLRRAHAFTLCPRRNCFQTRRSAVWQYCEILIWRCLEGYSQVLT